MQRYGVHTLTLVFPPLSNQEAEWMWKDADVRREVSCSKLYMIGQRKEVFFLNFSIHEEENSIFFDLECGDIEMKGISIPLDQFQTPKNHTFYLEGGPKFFRIYSGENGLTDLKNEAHLVAWYTPDRLFMDFSKNSIVVRGVDHFRKFTNYLLYYVGISKEGDSFSRLFRTAHEKRSRILGNERQIKPDARLTDELMIFLFKVEDMQIVTCETDEANPEILFTDFSISPETLSADAEKAFIKIMLSEYNEKTYPNFPRSSDGLYQEGFNRYSFVINEAITFITPHARIRGARFYDFNNEDVPDMIVVEGENVEHLTPEVMKERSDRGNFSIKPSIKDNTEN